jgi:diadenosine tetraphosphatase ApaH/serine/threonine PP2A family protein phosphatase
MKFAAIADVHGNCFALEAVLADIAALGITEVVNLGDHVSGPLEPRRTADLLMQRGFPSIRGDQDRRLVELGPAGTSSRFDHKQLDRNHLDWLASLPPTLIYRDDVLLCHGSPQSDAAWWLDRVTADGSIQPTPIQEVEAEALSIEGLGVEGLGIEGLGLHASLILCGHTHLPRVVRLRDGRLVVNAGSVGCPGYDGTRPVYHKVQTGTPDACYAILERSPRGWSVTFRYVPYDHMSMAELARTNGLPVWASALATGWIE